MLGGTRTQINCVIVDEGADEGGMIGVGADSDAEKHLFCFNVCSAGRFSAGTVIIEYRTRDSFATVGFEEDCNTRIVCVF